jgi:FkbM family methyltransferase
MTIKPPLGGLFFDIILNNLYHKYMTSISQSLFTFFTSISKSLFFIPRGKIGVFCNSILLKLGLNPIQTYKANNGLKYISDLRSYTENYVPWTGEYEGKTLNSILPLVHKNQNVLDIGANVGYWTINLATKVNKKQTVFAFEPVPNNFERVKSIISLNKIQNVEVFNIGLGDKKSRADFNVGDYDTKHNASTFNSSMHVSKNGVCQIEKFDDVSRKNNIENVGFIKIDVEGFEMKFLHGAKSFLKKNRPIIYGEFTPDSIIENGDNPKEIFSYFQDYVFLQEQKNGSFTEITNMTFTRDILLIPKEKLDWCKKNRLNLT